jgi:hypothetical protein
VSKNDAPIPLLPLFESRFDLSTFAEGWIKRSLRAAGGLVPSIVRPRILGVGLLVGEWSEIGIDPHIDAGLLEAAWNMALGALQTLATELKSDIVAFYNFNDHGRLPGEVLKSFNRVQCLPCARLPISFDSVDGYLSRLSRATRKDLRRKMRVSPEITVVRSRDISLFLDRNHRLYLETVERCPMAFGVHNRLFLEKICERVPGAEYTLYFVQEELVAFSLLVVKQSDGGQVFLHGLRVGRKYNLYFLSWLENVRCVEQKYLSTTQDRRGEHQGAPGCDVNPERYSVQAPPAGVDRFLIERRALIEDPQIPRVLACRRPRPGGNTR